ncbi:Homeodomain-like DNA binding domain-containing transcription factor [Phycomyces blakesleeanus]
MSVKPRSMTAGARNVLRSNDSASLWNCTLSPGWTEEESELLRSALMKFGIGNWAKIIESGCLPGKTNAQMNLQLQRLLGQQSTAEFAGLHINPKVVGEKNSKIQGPHIKRKNNCIVNTGGKLTREELRERLLKNKKLYELPESEWSDIELPKMEDPMLLLESKKAEMQRLNDELEKVQQKIQKMREAHPGRMEKLKSEVSRSPSPATPSADEDDELMPTIISTEDDLAIALALQNEDDSPILEAEDEEAEDEEFVPKRRRLGKSKKNFI